MIYVEDQKLAFLHPMKTGGTSVVQWFKQQWPQYTRIIKEGWHEPLRNKMMAHSLGDVNIITTIRNPYAVPVSFYAFWKGFLPGRNHQVKAAHQLEFPEFIDWFISEAKQVKHNSPITFWDFYNVKGKIPSNLTIVKLEEIYTLPIIIESKGISLKPIQIPWHTKSQHGIVASYYNEETAKKIRGLYRWTFEQGYYSEEL